MTIIQSPTIETEHILVDDSGINIAVGTKEECETKLKELSVKVKNKVV